MGPRRGGGRGADGPDRAQPQPELLIQIAQPAGVPVHAVLSCAPVPDDAGMLRGCLVSFEGIDGAGKSTHNGHVAERWQQRGLRVERTREPGGTPLAETLRTD